MFCDALMSFGTTHLGRPLNTLVLVLVVVFEVRVVVLVQEGLVVLSSSAEAVVVVRTVSKRHIKSTSGLLLHAGEVALTVLKHHIKTTSSSLLHAREVEDMATASKCAKHPPPAHFCTRGRWRRQESTFGTLCKRGRWSRGRHQENARKDHLSGEGGAAPLRISQGRWRRQKSTSSSLLQ